jgi:hypothetical protein
VNLLNANHFLFNFFIENEMNLLPAGLPFVYSLSGAIGRLANPPELSCSVYQCGCSSIVPGSLKMIKL